MLPFGHPHGRCWPLSNTTKHRLIRFQQIGLIDIVSLCDQAAILTFAPIKSKFFCLQFIFFSKQTYGKIIYNALILNFNTFYIDYNAIFRTITTQSGYYAMFFPKAKETVYCILRLIAILASWKQHFIEVKRKPYNGVCFSLFAGK